MLQTVVFSYIVPYVHFFNGHSTLNNKLSILTAAGVLDMGFVVAGLSMVL